MIFQGFYRTSQYKYCDHLIEIVDTGSISGSSEGEYPIIRCLLNESPPDQFFGYFSWKVDVKLAGAFRKFLFEVEKNKTSFDFIYVNAMIMGRAIFQCPYRQGDWSGHIGMLSCAEELGLVQEFDHFAMNHFVVGNCKFWRYYLEYHRALEGRVGGNARLLEIWNGAGMYSRNGDIPMRTFLRERALNNVMKDCALRGLEYKIPFRSFYEKYSKGFGKNTSDAYRLYKDNLLTSKALWDFGFKSDHQFRLLCALDDPSVSSPN